jgi:hypothetical protein
MSSSPIRSIAISCEKCDFSIDCLILNSYKCQDFAPALTSSFTVEPVVDMSFMPVWEEYY